MSGQEALFDIPGEVGRTIPSRTEDPPTSHAAAGAVSVRARSQRALLLAAYGQVPDATDDEAQELSGVSVTSCYWKRCSELREGGYIATTGEERDGRAGVKRIVCRLTDRGRAVLAQLEGAGR